MDFQKLLLSMDAEYVHNVESILDYHFETPTFLIEAMYHRSYGGKKHLERYKTWGHHLLHHLGEEHLAMYPKADKKQLNDLFSANVDTEKLARAAINRGLHKFLLHKSESLNAKIEIFKQEMMEYQTHSYGLTNPPKPLADMVEAIIGAVHRDSGSLERSIEVFKRLAHPLITMESLGKHPLNELAELCNKLGKDLHFIDSWDNDKTMKASISGTCYATATYHHCKQVAKTRAANIALNLLKSELSSAGDTKL